MGLAHCNSFILDAAPDSLLFALENKFSTEQTQWWQDCYELVIEKPYKITEMTKPVKQFWMKEKKNCMKAKIPNIIDKILNLTLSQLNDLV